MHSHFFCNSLGGIVYDVEFEMHVFALLIVVKIVESHSNLSYVANQLLEIGGQSRFWFYKFDGTGFTSTILPYHNKVLFVVNIVSVGLICLVICICRICFELVIGGGIRRGVLLVVSVDGWRLNRFFNQ